MSATPDVPRAVAVRVLTRVLSEHETLDQAFASVSGEIKPEQRGWLQEVCSGTLRWKGRLDRALDSLALKKKPSGWLRKTLLISAYQLVAQPRTPAGRVVSETVDLIRAQEGEKPAGFANALLRKLAEQSTLWRELPFPQKASNAEQAAWASLPEWFWAWLLRDHGLSWAREFALGALERPRLWIRVSAPGIFSEIEGLASGGIPGSMVLEGSVAKPIPQWPGFAEGKFFVQDISSQRLVAEVSAAARASRGSQKLRVLDLCAAPGGKSAGLAWEGFEVFATDIEPARFALLEQTLGRVAPQAQILRDRAAVAAVPPMDLIWVDAPCTGSGIIGRHPDVRWLRREQDLEGLASVQTELLREAWDMLPSGGLLMYSVCSVLKAEGPARMEAAALAGAEPLREWLLAPHLAPDHGDGFWGRLIKKT